MSEEPIQPPSTSLVAGKYQLLGMIGRGGMGSVWEGRHITLGTKVAIKFIEKEYAQSEEARSRFDNEARAAATIQSKHAIQIFDHGVTDDGKPYIVMEMLEGEPLDKRLERLGRMPLQETARVLSQVCRALNRAHERGIVHRDLKPENIFLVRTQDDDEDVAKVLDFGIAKIRGPAGQSLSNSTKTGAVLGTPYYMSPEQARGLRNIDHRTDLWSLGVIVFKCVTGVLPFEGESLGDLLVKICTTPLPVPSQVLPGLPPMFDAWFARALDRDPSKRFANAQELADALSYACGISVRRPASSSVPQQQELGNARTVASTPPPVFSPSQSHGQSHGGSHPGYGSGGVGGSVPTNYPTDGARHSAQSGFPAQRGPNGTAAPFTASSPQVRTGSSGALVAVIAIAAALLGGVLILLLVGNRKNTPTSVLAGPSAMAVITPGASVQVPLPPATPPLPAIELAGPALTIAPSASVTKPPPPSGTRPHGGRTSPGAAPQPPVGAGGVANRPPPGVTISPPPGTPSLPPQGKQTTPGELGPGF
jgi:serine/threonine protein kinase